MEYRYRLRKVAEGQNLAFFIADSLISPTYKESEKNNIEKLLLLRVEIQKEQTSCEITQLWIESQNLFRGD